MKKIIFVVETDAAVYPVANVDAYEDNSNLEAVIVSHTSEAKNVMRNVLEANPDETFVKWFVIDTDGRFIDKHTDAP